MARRSSNTLIGAFVVGAVALAVVGLTSAGAGKFLHKGPTCVMYFSGSIAGLSVGSPVMFRGVKVGEVTKIAAVFNTRDVSIAIPVYIRFDTGSLIVHGDQTRLSEPDRYYEPLLEKGLKAQLEIQSFITAQLYVSLDFHPETPPRLVGLDKRFAEIPTIPSEKEHLAETLRTLPDKLVSVATGVERLLDSPSTQETIDGLAVAMRDLNVLLREVTTEVKPLATSLRATSSAAQRTFEQAERTLALKEGPAAEIAANMIDTLKAARASLDQLHSTLGSFQALAEQNAGVGEELARTLGQLDEAAIAVRSLAEYVELHPEAMLKGRR